MRRGRVILALAALLLAGAAPASTDLTWSPDLQVVEPGLAGHLSVITTDPVALRTVDVVIEADPDLLLDVAASPGAVFDGVPCMIWQESEILAPGRWHGFAVIIGAECEATGPGELLRWDFIAGEAGGTVVRTVEVRLYAPDGSLLEDVSLDHATVLVSAVSDAPPPAAAAAAVRLAPNPFNPQVAVALTGAGEGTLSVHDLRGRLLARRRVAVLPGTVTWDGRDDGGRDLPSGTYLFVLRDAAGRRATARGTLVR